MAHRMINRRGTASIAQRNKGCSHENERRMDGSNHDRLYQGVRSSLSMLHLPQSLVKLAVGITLQVLQRVEHGSIMSVNGSVDAPEVFGESRFLQQPQRFTCRQFRIGPGFKLLHVSLPRYQRRLRCRRGERRFYARKHPVISVEEMGVVLLHSLQQEIPPDPPSENQPYHQRDGDKNADDNDQKPDVEVIKHLLVGRIHFQRKTVYGEGIGYMCHKLRYEHAVHLRIDDRAVALLHDVYGKLKVLNPVDLKGGEIVHRAVCAYTVRCMGKEILLVDILEWSESVRGIRKQDCEIAGIARRQVKGGLLADLQAVGEKSAAHVHFLGKAVQRKHDEK